MGLVGSLTGVPGTYDNHLLRQAQTARPDAQAAAMQNADPYYRAPDIETPADLIAGRPLDRERREVVVPSFDGHPCREAAQFLWLMARETGTAPPWRVRVHATLCAKYDRGRARGGLFLIAQALDPWASVIMSPDGRFPLPPLDGTKAIEFNWSDQPIAASSGSARSAGDLILPSGVERSARTTTST